MKNITFFTLLGFCLLLSNNAFSQQENQLNRIGLAYDTYHSNHPQEKIYLHLDKEYYSPSDTIWFKSYHVNANSHIPESYSGIVYVELINPQSKIISQVKLLSEKGFSSSSFILPDSVAGNYQIRAYTNWMRNFGSDYFFTKPLSVISFAASAIGNKIYATSVVKPSSTEDTLGKQIDLQFFPEGGNLLAGLEMKVAFKAISANGSGIAIDGYITNEAGKFLDSIKSNALGMGTFRLLAEKGESYYAHINGLDKKIALPKPVDDAYTLSLGITDPNFIQIKARTNISKSAFSVIQKEMLLIGQCKGNIYFSAKGDLSKRGYFYVDVPRKLFPSGVIQFTLFDGLGNPQAERLTFVNHQDQLNISINANKKQYNPREKVDLTIEVKDKHGEPVAANLSLAVVDELQQPVLDSLSENIVTNLLLNSELKGFIESPQQYFKDTTAQTQQALDLVMLTHGWRRFIWKDILKDSLPNLQFKRETELSFSGIAENKESKAPVSEVQFSLMLMNQPPTFLQSKIIDKNAFYFGLPNFQDSLKVVLQTNDKKGKQQKIQISLNEHLSPAISSVSFPSLHEALQNGKYSLSTRLSKSKNEKLEDKKFLLKEVVVTADKPAEKVNFFLLQTIDVEAVEKSMNYKYQNFLYLVADQLKGVLAKVVRSDDGGLVLIVVRGKYSYAPEFVINGYRYTSYELPDIEIASIKTLEIGERFFPYPRGFAKEIHITTYKDGYRRSYPPGINIFQIAGFTKTREFYSPQYDKPLNKIEDNRCTLYWNPNIQTDKDGKATLSFYNSDKVSKFIFNVEGISYSGEVGAYNSNLIMFK